MVIDLKLRVGTVLTILLVCFIFLFCLFAIYLPVGNVGSFVRTTLLHT